VSNTGSNSVTPIRTRTNTALTAIKVSGLTPARSPLRLMRQRQTSLAILS